MRVFTTALAMVSVLAVGLLTMEAVQCGQKSSTVGFGYKPDIDFSQYKTFSWVPIESIPIAVSGSEISAEEAAEEVRAAVEHELAEMGFRKAESGQADFQVFCHGIIRIRALTIGIVDNQENVVSWRGEFEGRNVEVRAFIQEAVKEILKSFPPPPS